MIPVGVFSAGPCAALNARRLSPFVDELVDVVHLPASGLYAAVQLDRFHAYAGKRRAALARPIHGSGDRLRLPRGGSADGFASLRHRGQSGKVAFQLDFLVRCS